MNLFKYIWKTDSHRITAFSNGKIIHMEEIPDTAFSNRLIGDGLALEVDSNQIYAPCYGQVTSIAATRHAFTLLLENGVELLIHIGLNHDIIKEQYFQYHVKPGDLITPETNILTLNQKLLDLHQSKIIIPIVILNCNEHPIKTMTTASYIKKGKTLFTYK